VLVVDVDPQSNATTGLGIDHRTLAGSTYELMVDGATFDSVVRATGIKGLDCVPSSPDLAGAEVELVGEMAREGKLAEALQPAHHRYEVIFLDCPPSLGLLTVNALAAAHDLIVPVQCEYYALEGLGQLLSTAERVHRTVNPALRIAGFVMTMYDARTRLSSQVADEVRSHFGSFVFDTIVPRSVRISEAPSFGEPVLTLDPSSRGAISHRLLAVEFESRYGLDTHVPAPPPREQTRGDLGRTAEQTRGDLGRTAEQTRGDLREPVAQMATPGPGRRGYGVATSEPADMDASWPPRDPWSTT
jgi:chromosome partitioning protein